MARTFAPRDAREINNRFSAFFVEFSDGFIINPNECFPQRGINNTIQAAIEYAQRIIEARWGRVEITFNVYGARFGGNNEYIRTNELIYHW